mmetsp:Transcript_2674/g.7336  ORF Transcript_2674/g.7336 Transcript_2674/m.7336 type:complete len:86 (-) Transcript_2674:881-1138(-)
MDMRPTTLTVIATIMSVFTKCALGDRPWRRLRKKGDNTNSPSAKDRYEKTWFAVSSLLERSTDVAIADPSDTAPETVSVIDFLNL